MPFFSRASPQIETAFELAGATSRGWAAMFSRRISGVSASSRLDPGTHAGKLAQAVRLVAAPTSSRLRKVFISKDFGWIYGKTPGPFRHVVRPQNCEVKVRIIRRRVTRRPDISDGISPCQLHAFAKACVVTLEMRVVVNEPTARIG